MRIGGVNRTILSSTSLLDRSNEERPSAVFRMYGEVEHCRHLFSFSIQGSELSLQEIEVYLGGTAAADYESGIIHLFFRMW